MFVVSKLRRIDLSQLQEPRPMAHPASACGDRDRSVFLEEPLCRDIRAPRQACLWLVRRSRAEIFAGILHRQIAAFAFHPDRLFPLRSGLS